MQINLGNLHHVLLYRNSYIFHKKGNNWMTKCTKGSAQQIPMVANFCIKLNHVSMQYNYVNMQVK